MLQKLNERIHGMIAWIVIILIAVTFTLFGVDYYMQSRQTSDVEVSVNGESITKQTYEINYRRIHQQPEYEHLSLSSENALKKQVLDNMIVNLLSVQSASTDGFLVSNEQANQAIVTIPQFQQDGQFSAERYQQALSGAMYTPESFRSQVRQGMLLNQQRFAFIGSAFALPNEITRFVKLYMQTRDYDYLIIPVKQFENTVQVSYEDVAHYYDKHKQDFISPEQISIEYVRLSLARIKENIQVDDMEIRKYYQENKSDFLTPVQWKVDKISFVVPDEDSLDAENEIKQKADAAYEAIQRDPQQFARWKEITAVNQILHGEKSTSLMSMSNSKPNSSEWIVAGTTQNDKVLAKLTSPGQVTPPIKTAQGFEILKLIAYKKAQLKPMNEVKKQIAEHLVSEISQAHYSQALEELTDLSYQTPDSLLPVAEALKVNVEKTPLFTKDGKNTLFAKNRPVINAAFSHDVLDLGNNSEPIQLDNDSVIVLRVNEHIPVAQKKLSEVQDEIKNKLIFLKEKSAAKKVGQELIDTLNQDQKMNMLKKNHLEWQSVQDASRDSDPSQALISDLAFSLTSVNSQIGGGLTNGDYVIVKLKKIHDGEYHSLDSEQQSSLAQQIEASYGVMDYDLYINHLVASAKIDR